MCVIHYTEGDLAACISELPTPRITGLLSQYCPCLCWWALRSQWQAKWLTRQTNPGSPVRTRRRKGPRTWELPPITVYGYAPLSDDDRIGAYAQPRWTAHRVFGETRVYVIPKGMVEFEYWLKPEWERNGAPANFTHQFELEFGLPYRFQLDLYAVSNQTGAAGPLQFDEQKVELRWALADWNKIPGNPAFYLEWNPRSNAPPHVEGKLLLGGSVASGSHWGSNLVFEHEAGGLQENSREWTAGISRTVRDAKLSLGLETKLALVDRKDSKGIRGNLEKQFGIGPSLQVRPLPPMHLDFAALIGANQQRSPSWDVRRAGLGILARIEPPRPAPAGRQTAMVRVDLQGCRPAAAAARMFHGEPPGLELPEEQDNP